MAYSCSLNVNKIYANNRNGSPFELVLSVEGTIRVPADKIRVLGVSVPHSIKPDAVQKIESVPFLRLTPENSARPWPECSDCSERAGCPWAIPQPGTSNQIISAVIAYLNTHFLTHWRLEDLARIVNLNPQYLSRLFSEAANGLTITQYVNRLKVQASLFHLHDFRLTLEEVAEKSGFQTLKSYYRAFGQAFAMTPGKFRKTGGYCCPETLEKAKDACL